MDGQSGALLRIGAVSPCWFCENKICRYQTVTFNKDGFSDLTNIFLFLLLVGGLVSSFSSAEAAVKYVDVDVLHVREDPFEDSPIAFKLKRNESIDELDTLNNWSAFKDPDYPGQTFWVASRFLSDQKSETYSLTDKKTPGGGGLSKIHGALLIVGVLLFFGGLGGKINRRFKTGFEGNITPNYKMISAGLLLIVITFVAI